MSCVGDVQECTEARYTEQPKAQQKLIRVGSSSWACEPELLQEGALEPEELVNALDT